MAIKSIGGAMRDKQRTNRARKPVDWQITRAGRSWRADEALDRYFMAPEKIEMVDGKLLNSDEERLRMLALLLENVGVDAAVRIGDPDVWREAIARLPQK